MKPEIKEKITATNQKYLKKFLTEEAPAKLESQLEHMDWSYLDMINNKEQQRGTFSPLAAMELSEIEANKDKYLATGFDAVKNGKVGAILLAGGQGTRLGFDKAKGMFNIGKTKELYIFEQLVANLMKVTNQTGTWVPLYVMTSEINDSMTREFFEEHDYFGYNKDYVKFFVQEMVPAVDFDGNYYTVPSGTKETRILRCFEEEEYKRTKLHFGDVNVNEVISMFQKLQFHNHQNLGYVTLTQPLKKDYDTESAWITLPENVVRAYRSLLVPNRQGQYILNDHFEGMKYAVAGNHLHDISGAIGDYAESFGYGVVRDLCGHGIGTHMHEDPEIPNYRKFRRGIKLRAGMTLAVEPMINLGTERVVWMDDDWTVVTQDMDLSAHYENTILIREGKPEILSLTDSEIAEGIWSNDPIL